MYVVDLTYVVPLEEIDALIPAHIAWLDQQYAAGHFLASGRKVPRTGGVILAAGMERAALDAILATDPFQEHRVARVTVTEFQATKSAAGLEGLLR